ncbi:phosphomannomutase [Microbulbifer sp. SH-1]|uniref:phosphomannomutase n=1 Tax=Microbulbifer sp. SH-1 TaxID=2681547 RepID=UPI00140A9A1E|nr:phosphomannomutase [Microbulbifer sp. SH-1]QIL90189.1 phosphomannomutase [Microbulbifer sp. SH-1]
MSQPPVPTFPVTAFKAYDVRGRVPDELNETIAWRIGYGFARLLGAHNLVVGHDIRLSSPALTEAVIDGICAAGCNAVHIGQCGTEEIYFATFAGDNAGKRFDGGLCITASHNPADYNGIKLVQAGAAPLAGDCDLDKLKALVADAEMLPAATPGTACHCDFKAQYNTHLMQWIDTNRLRPLRIVVNAGNGGAGNIVDRLEPLLPFEFIKLNHQPDGRFPKGVPNPLLLENREETARAVIQNKADLGIAWDGDFDRCFFFDEQGRFVDGYYVVGLLAQILLQKTPGAAIVHDPRLYWNTRAVVEAAGGTSRISKTGHAFIKQVMRAEDAVYGGEMSAHHYFRDFAYCDNGTIPWLLITEYLSARNQPLSTLVAEMQRAFPCSDEINRSVDDPDAILHKIRNHFDGQQTATETLDGLGLEFDHWRVNIRQSNTEPLLRLNLETRADSCLLREKTEALLALIEH